MPVVNIYVDRDRFSRLTRDVSGLNVDKLLRYHAVNLANVIKPVISSHTSFPENEVAVRGIVPEVSIDCFLYEIEVLSLYSEKRWKDREFQSMVGREIRSAVSDCLVELWPAGESKEQGAFFCVELLMKNGVFFD